MSFKTEKNIDLDPKIKKQIDKQIELIRKQIKKINLTGYNKKFNKKVDNLVKIVRNQSKDLTYKGNDVKEILDYILNKSPEIYDEVQQLINKAVQQHIVNRIKNFRFGNLFKGGARRTKKQKKQKTKGKGKGKHRGKSTRRNKRTRKVSK